jgi:hypothetical protein
MTVKTAALTKRLFERWCAFSILLLTASLCSPAWDGPPLEYQVKAAFLLNFTKFVDWRNDTFADPPAPIAICIAGDAPIELPLNQMVEGETVGGRKLVVQKLPPDVSKCQALFISKSEKDVPKLLANLPRSVLTVGESEGFLADGGMINFVIENRRVRFDINQKAVNNSNLKLSSKLFNVARQVEK